MARRAKTSSGKSFFSRNASAGSMVPADILGPRLIILLTVLALLVIGLVMVYSSSSIAAFEEGSSTESYLIKQLGFAVVGAVCCVVVWKFIPYRAWQGPLVWIAWGVALFLLVLTAAIGTVGLGAQRWVNVGPLSLQPSEFAKIAFLLMAARILIDFRQGNLDFRGMVVQTALLVLVPLLLMYRSQSDLGTTLICFVGILMVMWLGEVPLRVIAGIILAGVVFAAFASLVGYRQDRFVFLNPWDDGEGGLGAGYQLIHSFYAFAEGGLFGVGLGNSHEKFQYLPEAETDFIFAIIGEELGLVGALVVIVLFLLFLYAGLRIARSAPDEFGTLLAGGFTAMVVFQAFLNIGCVIGVFPTTGKPLPFISSGGSSLIASLIMFGVILSVSQGSDVPSIYEQRRADLRVVRAQTSAPSFSGRKQDKNKKRTSNQTNAQRRGGRGKETSSSRSQRRLKTDSKRR